MRNLKYIFKHKITDKCIEGRVEYKNNEILPSIPRRKESTFSLLIGKGYIELNAIESSNRITDFGGYTPLELWKFINLQLPQHEKGEVYLYTDYTNNLYDIRCGQDFPEIWDIYYDDKQKIWCMGNPIAEEGDIGIEFYTDEILVINNEKLKSIWVKNLQVDNIKGTRKSGIFKIRKKI